MHSVLPFPTRQDPGAGMKEEDGQTQPHKQDQFSSRPTAPILQGQVSSSVKHRPVPQQRLPYATTMTPRAARLSHVRLPDLQDAMSTRVEVERPQEVSGAGKEETKTKINQNAWDLAHTKPP